MKVTVSCLLSSALFRTSALRRLTIRSWRWWRCSAACRWPCPESSTCSTTASHRWRTAHIPAYLNMSSWQHSKRKTWQTVEHKHSMSSNTTHWCTFGGACVTRSHKNLAVWQQRTEEVKQGKALYAWQAGLVWQLLFSALLRLSAARWRSPSWGRRESRCRWTERPGSSRPASSRSSTRTGRRCSPETE